MNVRKVKEIIKFDVEKSIQNKWFVILNVLTFIGILIATNWSNISKFMDEHNINIGTQEKFTIQVVDNDNLVFSDIEKLFEKEENIVVEKVEENTYSKENVPEEKLLLIEVKLDPEKIISTTIVSKESVDSGIYDRIYNLLVETRSKVFASQKRCYRRRT